MAWKRTKSSEFTFAAYGTVVPGNLLTIDQCCCVGSVADPDPRSDAFLAPESGICDPGWVIKLRSGSGDPG
jgi:hypothetical protein